MSIEHFVIETPKSTPSVWRFTPLTTQADRVPRTTFNGRLASTAVENVA
jgi:hypothetical protein